MKSSIVFMVMFCCLVLGLTESPRAQSVKSQLNPIITDEMVAEARRMMPDEKLGQLLRSSPLGKGRLIGPREMQVARYFADKSYIIMKHSGDWRWRLKFTDVVVVGAIQEIQELRTCGYRTAVLVAVDKYIKGESQDKVVTVKLVSGKNPDGSISWVSTEPKFRVGEKVLLFLKKTPHGLYTHLESKPCPDNQSLWYKTETEGYFEPGYVYPQKFAIGEDGTLEWPFDENGKTDWPGSKKDISAVTQTILMSMQRELSW